MDQAQLLRLVEQLRFIGRKPIDAPQAFERICAIIRSIQEEAATPLIAALALDVRFKSEDVYVRPHLMPEAVLRQMLDDKLQLLEATVRAGMPSLDRRLAGNMGRRAGDRATA